MVLPFQSSTQGLDTERLKTKAKTYPVLYNGDLNLGRKIIYSVMNILTDN